LILEKIDKTELIINENNKSTATATTELNNKDALIKGVLQKKRFSG
jgi:hypothetical protein